MNGQPAPDSFQTFGTLLRYLRKRARLSQRDLAIQVGYHFSYLSRLESDVHPPDIATLKARFLPALHLEDQKKWAERLLELAQPAEPIMRRTPPAALPVSLTSLLGREQEVDLLLELLENEKTRLITIVGPPGVGKTRLALHIAEQANQTFGYEAIFVNLATVTEAEQTLPSIAGVLGIQELAEISMMEKLKAVLQKKKLLIVMDNFEQVLDASPQLIPLLGNAPGLKILATSREALRIRGEQEFQLAPLPVQAKSFLDSPAVQLFIERACDVKPDFEIQDQTASNVAEICRRLDGLPLAIELAAARVQTMSLSAMIEQFDNRFEWLTRGGRDLPAWRRTLWGAVEWSYNLLSEMERALFCRLSVFAGGWTLETAREVFCLDINCAPRDFTHLFMQLADKSLMAVDGERFYFLETLREFAYEKLLETSALEHAQQKHCEYFLNFAQTARPHLRQGGDEALWLDQVERENNNLRAALTWAVETPARAATAMELGWAIHPFWSARSHITEARRWLKQILALDPAPTPRRADLLRYSSDYAGMQGDFDGALGYEKEAMEISQRLEDEEGVYYSLDGMAILAGMQGDYKQAAKLLEQVLTYRRQTNDSIRLTSTLNNFATAMQRLQNYERARQLYTEMIEVTQKNGDSSGRAYALIGLANVHASLNDHIAAVRLLRENISIRRQLGEVYDLSISVGVFAKSAYHLGAIFLAVQMESAAEKIRQELGAVITPATRKENKKFLAQLRAGLGEGGFSSAWSAGQTMSLEQVIALAADDTQIPITEHGLFSDSSVNPDSSALDA